MKRDRIEHKGTHWEITLGGESRGTAEWASCPGCLISDSTMRKRCRNFNPAKHTVRWVVFGDKARSGNPRHAKTITDIERRTEVDQWEKERNRHAISPIWSPRLSDGILRHRMIARMVRKIEAIK